MWGWNSFRPQLDDAGTHRIRPTLDHCIKHLSTSFIVIESVNAATQFSSWQKLHPFFLITMWASNNLGVNPHEKLFKKTKFISWVNDDATNHCQSMILHASETIYISMKPKTEDLKQQPESFPRSSLYRHYYMIIQIVFAVVFFLIIIFFISIQSLWTKEKSTLNDWNAWTREKEIVFQTCHCLYKKTTTNLWISKSSKTQKKLPTLECLLTKKALKPYDNKKMLVYQSKRHHKITPILILLYPSILQKSLTKISVAFFGPWFWLPPFLPNIQTFFILPGVLKQRFFVNSLLIPNVVLQQNKTLNKSRKLLHTQ